MLLLRILFLIEASREFCLSIVNGTNWNRIFTGDIVEGAVWAVTGKLHTQRSEEDAADSLTDTEVGEDINNAYSLMQGLKSTVYSVVGNHDSCPVNSFPPPAVDTTITSQWVYNNISTDLQPWIGAAAAAEVKNNYGSYSVLDSSGVRIISVNTNFWYKVRKAQLLEAQQLIRDSKISGCMKRRWRVIQLDFSHGWLANLKLPKLLESVSG
jgi:hypothetical protein